MTDRDNSSQALRYVPLLVVLAGAIAGFFLLKDSLSFEALQRNSEALLAYREAHYGLAVLGFVAIYTLIVTFSLPGAAIASITGGYLFSMFPGTLLNMAAATLGASFVFLAARWGLGDTLTSRMEASDGALKRIKAGIDENQWSFLFVVRLIPVFPFFVLNLGLASVGVPLHRFVISTFFGIIPGAVVYTSVGAGLGEVLAQGETPNLGIIFEPHILLPILGLAALAALPMVVKFFKKRTNV
ncbi:MULTISPECIES: TVP38/TMEM64 family protein [Halocynthiibacter]|uniref:TVP38/TMEM64 family membrane protein n=1 Tax=Halocynthiibacter halioticoli TaxID=2986804 RepID=A0AAE3J184_9RHOB|nr:MULTISPECIES: VTT domain-containing protein [Halocynthiibacter]MCV6825484.1 VTT domain-containing protein [Halocynthiibacter halioticoli]MCW4058485.1 VTT domain-containing protein [Halocynthiibacter sp. SDUM655004]